VIGAFWEPPICVPVTLKPAKAFWIRPSLGIVAFLPITLGIKR
jgi:hypothetical protein